MVVQLEQPFTSLQAEFACRLAPSSRAMPLAALLRLHRRLSAVHPRGGEVHPALIKLAWWRDSLLRLTQDEAPAEPLLRELAQASGRMRPEALAELAEAHMERVEGGEAGAPERVFVRLAHELLAGAGGAAPLLGAVADEFAGGGQARGTVQPPLRPLTAMLVMRRKAGASPWRQRAAASFHMLTGRL